MQSFSQQSFATLPVTGLARINFKRFYQVQSSRHRRLSPASCQSCQSRQSQPSRFLSQAAFAGIARSLANPHRERTSMAELFNRSPFYKFIQLLTSGSSAPEIIKEELDPFLNRTFWLESRDGTAITTYERFIDLIARLRSITRKVYARGLKIEYWKETQRFMVSFYAVIDMHNGNAEVYFCGVVGRISGSSGKIMFFRLWRAQLQGEEATEFWTRRR